MAGGGAGADPSRWPLVGRDDELVLAIEAIGQRRGVVLTGQAGVGKTRLAHELIARSAGDGKRTEWIYATDAAAGVPLGAAAHLVPGAAIGGGGRDATLRGIVAALEREGARGALVLGVDDAHLLDDGSAALVHLLATTGTATVVATVRSGEAAPDAVVSRSPHGWESIARRRTDDPTRRGQARPTRQGRITGDGPVGST